MIRKIAKITGCAALKIFPPSHKAWGNAIIAEIEHIDSDPAALNFALGCLWASILESLKSQSTQSLIGQQFIILVTLAYAFFHLYCGIKGSMIALGASDPFFDQLMDGGKAEQAFALTYQDAIPYVATCLIMLGLSHIAGAYFLFKYQLRRWLGAWIAGLVIASLMISIELGVTPETEGLMTQVAALLIQAFAMPILWRTQNNDGNRQMKHRA